MEHQELLERLEISRLLALQSVVLGSEDGDEAIPYPNLRFGPWCAALMKQLLEALSASSFASKHGLAGDNTVWL